MMSERGIVATTPLPKVISACLDMLPHERRWDNGEFEEWLEMFEGACRIWYRLPTPPTVPKFVSACDCCPDGIHRRPFVR